MDIISRFRSGYESNSPEETVEAGWFFGSIMAENSMVALAGDFGAGKTTFVRGVAKFFGIMDSITSPTFNIFLLYSGRINLLHMDAYRLNHPREIEAIALEDFLIPPFGLLVEWPDNLGLFHWDYRLGFSINSMGGRIIRLEIDETGTSNTIG
ncbi:MAG: tRNA (adenosine(37)-N6)-threonylcarbamoyltransferase complex ATPase subunit type 1 TsaE [Puniceicoccales bacterium]|nr:tRNA (adenosine(37)-N6)-threonylcarbamoyltransferase complex ATPase subunit type 1 TsaE [Puniceicoccales bacterium]